MPFGLTKNDIRKSCGNSYYQRGERYQREDRVLAVEWDEDAEVLYGEVEGSGMNYYDQEIRFFPDGPNKIRGHCSCPVSLNCKHIVAVLLEWLEGCELLPILPSATGGKERLQNWLQETTHRLHDVSTVQRTEPGNACLLYLLQQTSNGDIELKTLKSRHLKRGGWGKCSSFPLSDLTDYGYGYYGSSAGALPLDKEIAKLLVQQQIYSHRLPLLEGDVGGLALERLLNTKRCFYNSIKNPPLTIGSPRTATFSWQTDGDDTQLKIELDGIPDNWLMIPTSPPCYLDTVSFQCGVIKTPLSTAMLHSLTKLPTVAAEQLRELSYFLLHELPPKVMPLPVELKINYLDEPPVPNLLLYSAPNHAGERYHLVEVRFDYGSLTLPPEMVTGNEREYISHNDEEWQVTRYPQEEVNALQVLADYGLAPTEEGIAGVDAINLFLSAESVESSALGWKNFIADLPKLEADGWRIEVDPSFEISFETITGLHADIEDNGVDWFEVGLNIEHDGHKIPLLPLLTQWLEGKSPQQSLMYRLPGSHWLEIPSSILQPVLDTLVELFEDPRLSDAGRLKLPRSQAHTMLEVEDQLQSSGGRLEWQGGASLRRIAEKLRNFEGIEKVSAPQGLKAELRDYQQQGLSWLQFLREYELNGVLADDMGLGKTIQTLSHLLLEKEAGRLECPALIVAPTSVLSNWQKECERFTPDLKCIIYHGAQRAVDFSKLTEHDVVITSYALLVRDCARHQQNNYHSLILDEAQAIKNPRAKSTLAAAAIKANHRLCLTGTPLENHLGELWSLFNFLMPGFLDNQKKFNKLFRTPIEKHQDGERQKKLQQRLAPFVLRRIKDQVAQELPPKTMMIREAELKTGQAKLYESLRLAMTKKIGKLLEKKGVQKSHIEILDALLKLRQACCDPRLVKLESARKVKQSAKLEVLVELLEKLLAEERKVLIFSQFTSMLSLIEEELQKLDIGYCKLTGRTKNRDAVISTFQEGAVPVFLISLKAGGVGLNLTAADTVIHYDPWWNPAVENQATDRAHRIGQEKPVFVYKLVATGTVEEKILQLQEKKQQLADGVYAQGKEAQPLARVSSEELLTLLAPIEE